MRWGSRRVWRQLAWTLGVLLPGFLLIALIFTRGIWAGEYRWTESFSEYIPWRVEAARQIAAGQFPFFTEKVFGGMPLLALSYVGVLYPPNLAYVFFPPWIHNQLSVFHMLLGGFGMYLYLRSRRLVELACFAGAMFFVSHSFLLYHDSHISMRETALAAPLVAWLARRVMHRPGPGRAAWLALGIALQIAIGYQQVFLFTVLWIGVDWLTDWRRTRRFALGTAWLAVAGLVGVALMGIQILPTLENVSSTFRELMTLESWQTGSFPPSHLLQFLSPAALGTPWGTYLGESIPGEAHGTIPPLGWALALLAPVLAMRDRRIFAGRRRAVAILWLAVGVTFLLACGSYLPFNAWLFRVPPFNMFRVPGRWLFLTGVFAAILGAMAMHLLARRPPGQRLAWLVCGFVALAALALGGCALLRTTDSATSIGEANLLDLAFVGSASADHRMAELMAPYGIRLGGLLDATGFPALLSLVAGLSALFPRKWKIAGAAVLCLPLALANLVAERYAHYGSDKLEAVIEYDRNPLFADVPIEEISRLHSVMADGNDLEALTFPHATFLFPGLRSMGGYCPLIGREFGDLTGIGQAGVGFWDETWLRNPALFRQFAVSHLITTQGRIPEALHLELGQRLGIDYEPVRNLGNVALFRVIGARPRFDLASAWRPAASDEEARTHAQYSDPSTTPSLALLDRPDWRLLPPAVEPFDPGVVEVLRDEPSFQSARVDSPDGTVLLIRDVYWRGWRYRVSGGDGDWIAMRRANFIFRYVPVPPGEHIVEMRYRPPTWDTAVAVSSSALAALLLLVIAGIWGTIRRIRRT